MLQAQRLISAALAMRMSVLPFPDASSYKPIICGPAGDILYNFHWVVPGEAARAAQAWAGGLEPFLQKRGIRAIINLRGRNDDLSWWQNETARRRTRAASPISTPCWIPASCPPAPCWCG